MATPNHIAVVKRGPEAIIDWRNMNTGTLHLSGATLSRANLSCADLSGVDLEHANLFGADLSGAELAGANLAHANLHEANLSGADLSAANLAGANLAGANLLEANLLEADLFHAGLTRARLAHADLTRVKLTHANLFEADLRHADLTHANLRHAEVTRANLSGAILTGADLSGVSLTEGNLSGATLAGATLYYANLSGADLSRTDFDGALCMGTIFANADLSLARSLETIKHAGPSEISINALCKSSGKIPVIFLRRAGVPQSLIDSLPDLVESPSPFYSCFISFIEADNALSKKLYEDLQAAGVRCWRYKEDAPWGSTLRKEIAKGIRLYDKLVVICSRKSLDVQPVIREIERALRKERTLKGTGGDSSVLFPIQIDDFISDGWQHAQRAEVLEKRIGDFRNWQQPEAYQAAFSQLLKNLNAPPA